MGHLQGGIATDLLLPAARERFDKLFAVAARKSLFSWRSTAHTLADVVLIDDATPAGVLGRIQPPCVVCLCKTSNHAAASNAPWQSRLSGDYTVADVIDLLDRAAVFLLDWQARPGVQRATAPAAVTPAVSPGAASVYRLGQWVSMGAPFNSQQCLRALALLAQGAVSARQISEHSGLEPARTTALLQELQQRGVLIASAKTAASPPAPRRAGQQPSAGASLVQRLSRWLNSATGQRA